MLVFIVSHLLKVNFTHTDQTCNFFKKLSASNFVCVHISAQNQTHEEQAIMPATSVGSACTLLTPKCSEKCVIQKPQAMYECSAIKNQ